MIATRTAALLLALAAVSLPARAETDDVPKVLACEFQSGTFTSFEAGQPKARRADPMNFNIVGLDLASMTATISTSAAGTFGQVRIVRAVGAIHFLEVLTEGFLATTTVYDPDPATGVRLALHSRHMGLVGQPLMASYTGVCRSR